MKLDVFLFWHKLVQVDGVEPPEPLKAMRLQRIPLPLRDKLAFDINNIYLYL